VHDQQPQVCDEDENGMCRRSNHDLFNVWVVIIGSGLNRTADYFPFELKESTWICTGIRRTGIEFELSTVRVHFFRLINALIVVRIYIYLQGEGSTSKQEFGCAAVDISWSLWTAPNILVPVYHYLLVESRVEEHFRRIGI
jgi:hypothetical protein